MTRSEERPVSRGSLSPDENRALQDLMAGLKRTYGSRLKRTLLYGRKTRGPNASDLDVLIVIENMGSRQAELGTIHRLTEPITLERDILVTVIPVDQGELERRGDTAFFSKILRNGVSLE